MKEAIEALFTDNGKPTQAHVDALKGVRSLNDVSADGIDPDAMDLFSYFLDAPKETAESQADEDRRSLLLALASHLAPTSKNEKPDEPKEPRRPIVPSKQEKEEKKKGVRDPRESILGAFDTVEIEEQTGEDEEEEVEEERPQRGNRRGQQNGDRPNGRTRDQDDQQYRRDRWQQRKDEKKDPQPPRPAIVQGSQDHLLARVQADPQWVELRNYIFGEILIVRGKDSTKVAGALWQLSELTDRLVHGEVMASRYTHNMRVLAGEMVTNLHLHKDIENPAWFEKRYGALPKSV